MARVSSAHSHAVPALALLCVGWAALFRAPLADLLDNASASSLRLNLVLGASLLVLVLVRTRGVRLDPRLRPGPLLVIGVTAAAHLLLSRTVDVALLSCTAMVVGAWGLAGLYLPAERWRQALPLAVAGICILPMGAALDIYLGFPLRIATASMVHTVLEPMGLSPTTAETIVLIEGTGVQVDLPCSGVNSLWSGALFWAAATWIERRRVGVAWILAGIGFAGLLVALNGARVLALVLLHGLAPPMAMTVLHMPLGLVAFATATVLGWALLRRLPTARPTPTVAQAHGPSHRRIWWLCAVVWAAGALPGADLAESTKPTTLERMDPTMEPIPLSPAETALFRDRHAAAVGKWQFELGDSRGQLVMVQGSSWRAQHRPDICHAAHGRVIETDEPILLATDLPARRLQLHDGEARATAFYWFQSAERTTNEHGARIWASFDGHAEDWVMVSVMVEPPRPADDPQLRALLLRIHAHAHTLLTRAPESPR